MKCLGETIVVIVAYFRKLETLSVSFAACRLQTQEAGAKAVGPYPQFSRKVDFVLRLMAGKLGLANASRNFRDATTVRKPASLCCRRRRVGLHIIS